MLSTLDRLVRLLDEYDQVASEMNPEALPQLEDLFDQREVVERELLTAPVRSDADVVVKMRYLARTLGDGERSDGLDVEAIQEVSTWLEKRFSITGTEQRSFAA